MHIIRLRGPWELEPVERFVKRSGGGYSAQQVVKPRESRQMPADWCELLGPDFLGVVRYRRKFNRPTNLTSERVWLVVEPPRSSGRVFVNNREMGCVRYGEPVGRFEINLILRDHNAVVIEVEHPELDDAGNALDKASASLPGGLVGEVRLEIED